MGWWNWATRRRAQWGVLSPCERGLLLEAAVLLPLVAIGRRRMSIQRLRGGLQRLPPAHRRCSPDEAARAVARAAAHGLVHANCLERSLVLWALLRRHGIESEVRLGFRGHGATFQAHAWVECAGSVLNDTGDVGERFSAFPTAPGGKRG